MEEEDNRLGEEAEGELGGSGGSGTDEGMTVGEEEGSWCAAPTAAGATAEEEEELSSALCGTEEEPEEVSLSLGIIT